MRGQVVRLRAQGGEIALLRPPPGLLPVRSESRPTAALLDAARAAAAADPLRAAELSALLGEAGLDPADISPAALRDALARGRLLALFIPFAPPASRLPGQATAGAAPNLLAAASTALAAASKGAAMPPGTDMAAASRALAAWAEQRMFAAGAAVPAIQAACPKAGIGATPCLAALLLESAARRLAADGRAQQAAGSGTAGEALVLAMQLLGAAEVIAALARMEAVLAGAGMARAG